MVRKPNARMCGRHCEPALRRQQTVRILFTENRNLSGFLRKHKENWMRRVSFPCTRGPLLASGLRKIN